MVGLRSLRSVQAQELAYPKQIRQILVVDGIACDFRRQLRSVVIVNLHSESSRSTRHSLSHAPHSQNAEDFATDLPSQKHVGAQGSPGSGSNQLLSFVSSTRSTQQKQHSDVGRCFTVDTRGVGDWNFPASGSFQIDMLKTHRVGSDNFYRG